VEHVEATVARLLRVTEDDPEYRHQAAAEAEYWQRVHPLGLEAAERTVGDGPVEHYVNARFTGDPHTEWTRTLAGWGAFRRVLMLGVSSPKRETNVLETNPELRLTLMDLSAAALERHAGMLGQRFEGRVATATADLNFVELPEERYDVIISSSTIHHVTNLEYLAFQINRALVPGGFFFLEDYVGEARFAFTEGKRRLYEILYDRDIGRQRGRKPGVIWLGTSDLSPFCGIRSDEILDVFRRYLDEVQVRTAATLPSLMSRTRPTDWDETWARTPRWKFATTALFEKVGMRPRRFPINRQLLEELAIVGDSAADAGLVRPAIAFAVYHKRRS